MYDEVDRQLDLARFAPGTEEAALLERMAVLMGEAGHRFDLVIFDTAPTGHTLRLLSLPEIMAVWTEGLLRSRDRSSRLGSMLQRLGAGPGRGDDQSLVGTPSDSSDARTARLREVLVARQRIMRRAREILLDADASGFALVLNPDKLSILESKRALQSLDRSHVHVSAVIVNRVLPEGEIGAFLDARRRQEAVYLTEITREFSHLPMGFLPLLPGDVRGLDALRQVGRLLTGA
jgi:arsenite-transporting ATPase